MWYASVVSEELLRVHLHESAASSTQQLSRSRSGEMSYEVGPEIRRELAAKQEETAMKDSVSVSCSLAVLHLDAQM